MQLTLSDAVQRTVEHREIFHDEMLALMRRIMSGETSPVMIAALLVGLRVKKETIGEIAAAAQVMREFATKVPVPDPDRLVDIVGTGGDASHTFNISTAAMFVAADAMLLRILGIPHSRALLVASAAVLVTIPLGTAASAALQVAAIVAIVTAALVSGRLRAGSATPTAR